METERHNLYIPKKLYDKIAYLAKEDLRSFNKECVFLLAQMVEYRREDLKDFEKQENDENE